MALGRDVVRRIRAPAAPLAGDTLSVTAAEQFFASTVSLGAASEVVAGRSYAVTFRGVSTIGLGLSITFRLYLGSTLIGTSPALTLTSGGARGWSITAEVDVITAGAAGVIEAQADSLVTLALGGTATGVNMANAAQITGVDLTASPALRVSVQGNILNLASTVTLRKVLAMATNAA